MSEALAILGHNNPPSPADEHEQAVLTLFDQAKHFADGEPIANEAQAKAVKQLDELLLRARQSADNQRKVEKQPHDDAAQAIQDRYNPILKRADLARTSLKALLTVWLRQVEEEKRAKEDEARRAAEAARAAAAAAFQESGHTDLEKREEAERLLAAAKQAEAAANRASKDKAIGLRTVYTYEMVKPSDFARWVWTQYPEDMREFLDRMAIKTIAAGHRGATVPGLVITQEKKA